MGYALGEQARREAVKAEMVVDSGVGGRGCEEKEREEKKVWENLGTHLGYFSSSQERIWNLIDIWFRVVKV